MEIAGIICEYNPFHRGHKRQLDLLRQTLGPDSGIVCLMSGNFVQRGEPAIFDKLTRTEAALRCGADLVLELPLPVALSSAEGFAKGGVDILAQFCSRLCFGAETPQVSKLMDTARVLLSEEFTAALRPQLDKGLSFPAARQQALGSLGCDGHILSTPNNILAVEYCKAILAGNYAMTPEVIHRPGDYHATVADKDAPSASSVRERMYRGEDWSEYIPPEAAACFRGKILHTPDAGERAILARLRTMTEEDFSRLPYGSEGLWRKLMHAAREQAGLAQIIEAVKSKRYTRTRISRMILWAFLGLTEADLTASVPYVRVLGFNDRGRQILRQAKESLTLVNTGEPQQDPYWLIEQRCSDLYGLFRLDSPAAAGQESRNRVVYLPEE